MTEYNVKSWVAFFQAFKRGEKKHDMRDLKDRDYQVGDILNLSCYPDKVKATRRRLVTYFV